MRIRAHSGFTLIEVMMASFILALVATGAIATTWKLADFARLKASGIAAESFCSDVAMSYMSQDLSRLVQPNIPVYRHTFTDSEKDSNRWFPRYQGKDLFGETVSVIPFWRKGYKNPTLTVYVTNNCNVAVNTVLVSVSLDWGIQGDNRFVPATFTMERGL